jgi:hypothetical protein
MCTLQNQLQRILALQSFLTYTYTCTLEAQYITAEKLQLCQVLFLSGAAWT